MAHDDNSTRGFGSLLSAFLLGATAGAAVALLTAPRSGRDTREQLKSATLDLKKKMGRVPEAMEEAGEEAVEIGAKAYERARDGING